MRFLDNLKALYSKEEYLLWSDIYRQLEDAARCGEASTTFTENFGAVRDLAEAEGLQWDNGKHEVQFVRVWGWE